MVAVVEMMEYTFVLVHACEDEGPKVVSGATQDVVDEHQVEAIRLRVMHSKNEVVEKKQMVVAAMMFGKILKVVVVGLVDVVLG